MPMKYILFLMMVFTSFHCYSQQDFVAAGHDASGSNGSVSYSIGQVAYVSETVTSGNINQGVQQPIEIFELTNSEFDSTSFNAILYPNPASTEVILSINSLNLDSTIEYQLTDITGKLIKSGRINTTETRIDVVGFPQACYFVNILDSNKILKSFKLLKNNK
jgi:hypothetical protein